MSVRSPEILDIRHELPPRLRAKAESVLDAGEVLLAWFEPDLCSQLNFSQGLILLTDTRLISLSEDDRELRSESRRRDRRRPARPGISRRRLPCRQRKKAGPPRWNWSTVKDWLPNGGIRQQGARPLTISSTVGNCSAAGNRRKARRPNRASRSARVAACPSRGSRAFARTARRCRGPSPDARSCGC